MFPSLEEKDLTKAAQSCKRLQIADQNRHEACERREANLSYDDLEEEDYEELLAQDDKDVRKAIRNLVIGASVAAIVIVSLFFYLTK